MTLSAGMCSVTFRDRSVPEVVRLGADADLDCIEWGGDVHVPHGDLEAAASAGRITREAGLVVASYGSYLFADRNGHASTGAVLDTAEALGTPLVRIWAPFGVEPAEAGEPADPERGEVIEALAGISRSASDRGMWLYLEFHGGTLTATARSACALLDAVDAPNLLCAWQPPYWAPQPVEADVADLALLAPNLAHLHAYTWTSDGTRRPLDSESGPWTARLAAAAATPAVGDLTRAALIEFVADDDPAAFAHDARCLHRWLADGDRPGDTGSANLGSSGSERL